MVVTACAAFLDLRKCLIPWNAWITVFCCSVWDQSWVLLGGSSQGSALGPLLYVYVNDIYIYVYDIYDIYVYVKCSIAVYVLQIADGTYDLFWRYTYT